MRHVCNAISVVCTPFHHPVAKLNHGKYDYARHGTNMEEAEDKAWFIGLVPAFLFILGPSTWLYFVIVLMD